MTQNMKIHKKYLEISEKIYTFAALSKYCNG